MSASILVQTRGLLQAEHVIADEVIRIGGDSSCQLHIPGIAPHALTLRFENGRYTLFNRSGRNISLESRTIEANGHAIWQTGEDLILDDDVILTLRLEGDPAPVRPKANSIPAVSLPPDAAPETSEHQQEITADDEPEPVADNTKMYLQLMVTVFCFVAFGVLLFLDSSGAVTQKIRDNDSVREEFNSLIKRIGSLAKESPSSSEELEQWRLLLQDGFSFSSGYRDVPEAAARAYGDLRSRVSRCREPIGGKFGSDPIGKLAEALDAFAEAEYLQLGTTVSPGD